MKKRLYGSNITFLKFFDQKDFGSFPRTLIGSIAVILFFYSMPLIIQFSKDRNNEFQNKSNPEKIK